MWKFMFILVLFYVQPRLCLYKDSELIISVNSENFEDYIESEKKPVILHVYVPQSQECKDVSNQFKRVALELKEIIKFASLQMNKEKDLALELGIKEPNTFYIVRRGQLQQFSGPIDAKHLVALVMNQVLANLDAVEEVGFQYFFKNVIQLSDDNFDSEILNEEKPWMILFYSPKITETKHMIPIWYEAAQQLRHRIKFGAVDCVRNEDLAKDYDVAGYPTGVLLVHDATYYLHYNVHLTPGFIVEWIDSKIKEYEEESFLNELTSQYRYEKCMEKPLCVIVFVPYILDCRALCRNNLLKIMMLTHDKYKGYNWGWLWSEAGSQGDLERALKVENDNSDVPAVVAVNTNKKIFTKMTENYGEAEMDAFLQSILLNKVPTNELKKPIRVYETEMWNGKDLEEKKNNLDYFDVDVKVKDEL